MAALLSPSEYFTTVRNLFREHGDPAIAQGQMAYMRNQFEYFGLKMPAWMAITKQLHATYGAPEGEELKALIQLCYADDHRELHYFAIETFQKTMKNQPAEGIDLLEMFILTHSWWDTVDWLAKLVGMHFRRFPELIRPVTARWMDSGELWLQRVCLIFQLFYKEKTDQTLLFDYIRRVAGSREFFLQKGAGWALRQYSKTNPAAVTAFIQKENLAPLTKREGMRLIKKETP